MDVPQPFYRSLNRLVALTLSCGVLSAAGFATLYSLPRPESKPAFWAVFTGVAILSLGGMLLMGFAASRLRDAVQNERWPQEDVELWRRRTRSGWWHALVGLALLLMLVALLTGNRHHGFMHGYILVYWPFFVAVQTLSQVSAGFRKTANFESSGSLPIWRDWHNLGKLKSDHWGQR